MKNLTVIWLQNNRIEMATYFNCDTGVFTAETLNDIYGTGQWAECYEESLPSDFSVDTYTIIDGELVRASAEVLEERAAAKLTEQNAAVSETRRQLYDDPNGECAPLYWNWIESQKEEDFEKWVAAKNAVRTQNPYIKVD